MKQVLDWVMTALLVAVLVMVVWTLGPILETKYFPVYSKFRIVSATPTPDGLAIVASFTKYRNCDPQGYAWYLGDFGQGMRQLPIATVTPYSTVHRPLGTQTTQAITIKGLKVEDLPALTAEIYNRCHPAWITRSIIYP